VRQVCHAHLLRKYVGFSERDGPAGAIGRELLELTSLAFEYWHGFKEGALTREELRLWIVTVHTPTFFCPRRMDGWIRS